ncbi:preprotein translocase subunit SecG [Candidatus Peregrinibacteria bacterium]|nr:MAG: preprotein translocase subunit SecG [Candidatus Peregrinibacteria bacterium]
MISQVVLSVLLTLIIISQNRDGGMSAVMGGATERFQAVRRGPEKVIFVLTVVLAALFMLNAVLLVVL